MENSRPFLSASVYFPRRYDLITDDVESALRALEAAGFAFAAGGPLAVATSRALPTIESLAKAGRPCGAAATVGKAIQLLRRVPADDWGQVFVTGRFPVGGRREKATAVVCPLWPSSPALTSAHVLFHRPGLLLQERSPPERAAFAVRAVDRLVPSFAPVAVFLDVEQPTLSAQFLRAGALPFLPWAGYLSPGAVRRLGAGTFRTLPHWLQWLEAKLGAPGATAWRQTPGGGLIWVLAEPGLGRGAVPPDARPALGPWRSYLRRVVA